MDIYQTVSFRADEIEMELKRLGRWTNQTLPDEAFEDMGAFGSNTMTFEQWLQFVLIPRIREIVQQRSDFPASSHLAAYAIRYFDGDYDADPLRELLYQLDEIINTKTEVKTTPAPTVVLGDTTVPEALYALADVLPYYELPALESQLQTFDTFLSFLSPMVRPAISALLKKAAMRTTQPECKKRIQQAAEDVLEGRRAAAPYNHELAMKKYLDDHNKNFPSQ